MPRHLFISTYNKLRSNWTDAFPDTVVREAVSPTSDADIIWVLLPWEGDVTKLMAEVRAAAGNIPVIALSDVPDDAQGLAALGAGVAGYCNGHAAPAVLQQVAATVLSGGTWIGQSIMRRLMSGVATISARKFTPPPQSEWAAGLTRREADVARIVALGSTNKEIARILNISERTVKAHLGAIFEKLKVRDRLQLIFRINGISEKLNH